MNNDENNSYPKNGYGLEDHRMNNQDYDYDLIKKRITKKIKESLIKERNSILNNPFKYILPCYRKKIKKIDSDLDKIDLELYSFENQNIKTKNNLELMILEARIRVKEFFADGEKDKGIKGLD